MTSALTKKGKQTHCSQHLHMLPSGIKPFYYLFSFFPDFLTTALLPFRRLHSCAANAFSNVQKKKNPARSRKIYPNPQRISEDKQARFRKLSEQQSKYHESMVSSIISNTAN